MAFIPLLITVSLTLTALLLTILPELLSTDRVGGGYFEVNTTATARAILAAILAGEISITVFGFSMMMVVVNQASSNYSPKVVETLSAQRSNQYILGIYLGTIVFTLITLMHIDSVKFSGGIPQAGLLVNMLLSIYSMLLFVKFINNISKAVRITSIVENIFRKTKESIAQMKRNGECKKLPVETNDWIACTANHSGYFQMLRIQPLVNLLRRKDAMIRIIPKRGSFYTKRSTLFLVNKELEEHTVNAIRSFFITYTGEVIHENPVYGFSQLREIAVKALSPGINDPGVAMLCIDFLGELLSLWIDHSENNLILDKDNKPRIIQNSFTFPEVLELSLAPVISYGKRDYKLLGSMLGTLGNISLYDREGTWKGLLQKYATSIVNDADKNIQNEIERMSFNQVVGEVNGKFYFDLRVLQ